MLLESLLPGIVSGVSALGGLLGANRDKQAALAAQQAALNTLATTNDQQYQNVLSNNQRTLYGMAGQGADAIRSLGANLGSEMAGAGVSNSSATAGALVQAQRNQDTSLASLASQNYFSANQLHDDQARALAQMQLGQANTNYGNAQNDLSGARQGLGAFIGSIAQQQLQALAARSDSAWQNGDLPGQQQQAALNASAGLYGPPGPALGAPLVDSTGPAQLPGTDPSSWMGSIGRATQNFLGTSGANAYRTQLPPMRGTLNQGANLPGNAGGLGSNAFYRAPDYGFSSVLQRQIPNGILPGR